MPGDRPSATLVQAARREIVACCALFVAAVVVAVLASRGTFNSMMMFPHVFAGIVSVVALLTLLRAKGVLMGVRVTLVAAVIVAAVAGPVIHERTFANLLGDIERDAMAGLGDLPAPEIPFVEAFHFLPATAGPLAFGGRPALVNFWSTSCDPCREEIPELKKFWNEHRGGAIDFFSVTKLYSEGEASADELEDLREFIDHYDLRYPTLVGAPDSPGHRAYRVRSYPTTVLIDGDGVVVDYGAGLRGSTRLMEEARALVAGVR